MSKWNQLPGKESIDKTIKALQVNGISAKFFTNRYDAKKKVFSLIPQGAEVMNMTSVTLETLGISQEIMESGKFHSIRKVFEGMDRKTHGLEMQKMGAAPEWTIGSVHAVTENGQVLIASNTGSQLPAYAYGASHLIWVVGAQKIVKDVDEGIKRIYEYVLPLESERAKKAYGAPGSNVSKLLIINKEINPARITLFLVNEVLGF